jgi:uncharacterized membrane protein YhaH (DUF805 family)
MTALAGLAGLVGLALLLFESVHALDGSTFTTGATILLYGGLSLIVVAGVLSIVAINRLGSPSTDAAAYTELRGYPRPYSPRASEITFASAVRICLTKFADYSGRAGRPEFWWFVLASVLFTVAIAFVGAVLTAATQSIAPLLVLYLLAVAGLLFPGSAVTVRRLHDTGRSGWWYWIGLVPFGGLLLLIFELTASDPGPNRHGPP